MPNEKSNHMHLLIITGFLGSGKTTLLLKIAELVGNRGYKVAIMVNEVGDIGIDDQFMRSLGFNVWELLGGCICCSLAGDVTGTLERISSEFNPDIILLEPTGAADPKNLMDVLKNYHGPPFKSLTRVALLDALRLDMLTAVVGPLITSTINQADLVLINKADAASSQELAFAEDTVHQLKPELPLFNICARDKITPRVIKELLPWMN